MLCFVPIWCGDWRTTSPTRSPTRSRAVCCVENSERASGGRNSGRGGNVEKQGGQIAKGGSRPSQRQRRLKSQRSKQIWSGEMGRVGCYCTCEEFSLEQVAEFLETEPSADLTVFDDSVHFRNAQRTEESVFVFPYGAVVIWGMDFASEQLVLTELRPFEDSPHEPPESDEFRYVYGDMPGIGNENMTLSKGVDGQVSLQERLALSHALAQSVKLSTFEQSVQETIAATRHLPTELAQRGRISASRNDVSKNVGRLFVDRHNVYLYADVLDTPDYFWDYETYEWLYSSAARYLELTQRAEWLFRRLDMVRELYDLLGQELQFKHSSDLEMIIIALITFEIFLTLAKDWIETVTSRFIAFVASTRMFLIYAVLVLCNIAIVFFLSKLLRRWKRAQSVPAMANGKN